MDNWNDAQWAKNAVMDHLKDRLQIGVVLLAKGSALSDMKLTAVLRRMRGPVTAHGRSSKTQQ